MLKFLFVAWIFNFRIFLTDFSPEFKFIGFSHLDELLCLQYMDRKLEMCSLYNNLNCNTIAPVVPDMSQTIHESLILQIR
jgi:hypothetical protein